VIIEVYHFYHLRSKILSNVCLTKLTHMERKLLGAISADSDVTRQLQIIYLASVEHQRKNRNAMRENISYLLTLRKLMVQLQVRSCITFSLRLVSL